MKSEQVTFRKVSDFKPEKLQPLVKQNPHLVFVFADCNFFEDANFVKGIKSQFGNANVIGCSTAGEIENNGTSTGGAVVTGLSFKNPKLKVTSTSSKGIEDSEGMGMRLAESLAAPDLNAIFVLGQGVKVNGSSLIQGLQKKAGEKVIITGGLAGDSARFAKTFVMLNEKTIEDGAVAIGFYGDSVKVSFGSVGGWQAFGPSRKVTKVESNILFEIDGTPALTVYKNYLGDFAKDLPGSALYFPLSVLTEGDDKTDLIRTILGVDEKNGILILAGDVPQDGHVRLMHAQTTDLVAGASKAADLAGKGMPSAEAESSFGILVSCVGRKLVVGDEDIEEEVEAVRASLHGIPVAGFYSNGEICPTNGFIKDCRLHNQTMTITVLRD